MRWLIVCLTILFMVTPAFAEEKPYTAVVGNDISANTFYLDPQYQQFLHDQTILGIPIADENFVISTLLNQPEICDLEGTGAPPGPFVTRGNANAKVVANNSGSFEWTIHLPEKPSGEINLCFQCGVVKPNAFLFFGFDAVKLCAAETGERVGTGVCTREVVDPGVNPVILAALPKITAKASPGPFAPVPFAPFNLTAFKNPSSYDPFSGTTLANNAAAQILDGSTEARVLLKSCMDKCVVVKLPVTGQVNALGQIEADLEAGDSINVHMDIPGQNTVDIYCHAESLKVMGNAFPATVVNTPTGSSVTVSPSGTGTDISFASVSSSGNTSVTISNTGPATPSGFQIGDPPTYYDIRTSATYAPPIRVCITYDPAQYSDPSTAQLLHYENGAWVDITTSNDLTNHIICGQTDTLSPFVIAQPEPLLVSPSVLWPPNHRMVPVTVSASDTAICEITSVSSNEPENGLGDGDTAPDWQITGNLTVNLRAERGRTGIGRIYTVAITCAYTTGTSSRNVTVTVPSNQARK